jgi:hypothetical protein
MYQEGAKRQAECLGGPTQATIAPKRGQVLDQIETQQKLIEALHGSIQALADRISMVLLPEAPCGESTGKDKQPECQLAEVLRGMNGRLGGAIKNIQGIISRCEL